MAGLCTPLPTLRRHPRGCQRTARGRGGSLRLPRGGLAPPTPCRSPGSLRLSSSYYSSWNHYQPCGKPRDRLPRPQSPRRCIAGRSINQPAAWSLNRRPVRNRQIRSTSAGKFPIHRHQRHLHCSRIRRPSAKTTCRADLPDPSRWRVLSIRRGRKTSRSAGGARRPAVLRAGGVAGSNIRFP
jgi:hypothetical protein